MSAANQLLTWAVFELKLTYTAALISLAEKLLDSDGSKEDSSVDSGTETSRSLYPDVRRESLIIPKKVSAVVLDLLTLLNDTFLELKKKNYLLTTVTTDKTRTTI